MDGDFTGTLHRSDVERLLCDCTVSRVVTGPTGLPIDVGPEMSRLALSIAGRWERLAPRLRLAARLEDLLDVPLTHASANEKRVC